MEATTSKEVVEEPPKDVVVVVETVKDPLPLKKKRKKSRKIPKAKGLKFVKFRALIFNSNEC